MKTKQQNRGVFLAVFYPPISIRFSGLYTKSTHRFFTPFQNKGATQFRIRTNIWKVFCLLHLHIFRAIKGRYQVKDYMSRPGRRSILNLSRGKNSSGHFGTHIAPTTEKSHCSCRFNSVAFHTKSGFLGTTCYPKSTSLESVLIFIGSKNALYQPFHNLHFPACTSKCK